MSKRIYHRDHLLKFDLINIGKKMFIYFIPKLTIIFLILSSFLIYCEKEHKDILAPEESAFPGAPTNIRAMIDNEMIILTWEIGNSSNIRSYHIYRKDSVNLKMELIDTTVTRQYTDKNVRIGRVYYYQISALNKQGYEGKRSVSVAARANIFSLMIEDGSGFTNKKIVSLNMTAPFGTHYMRVASDSLFTNSTWEIFVSTKNWALTENDGKKFVYVKFKDLDGNETQRPLMATITLDTKAVISEVRENTNGQTKVPGQIIHFTIVAGEAEGKATIDIGDDVTNLTLFDDGTNGDLLAKNGTYEVDYRIPSGLQILNAIIRGHFTDRVNNTANIVTAAGRVTIQQDPLAVTLYPPAPSGTQSIALELYWTLSPDDDFSCYRLYRSTTPGVDTSANMITMIANKTTTNFRDENIKSNTNYYYRVFVFDTFGRAKGSNEVVGKANSDQENPTPVVLSAPTPVVNSLTSLQLQWSKNADDDFASYRIYRSEAPKDVDANSFIVETIQEQNTTTFEDKNLKDNTEYNYQIYVFDTGGNSAGSNKVKGKTNANQPPKAVTLLTPSAGANSLTTLYLDWSKNEDDDFASYKLFRSTAAGVDANDLFVTMVSDQNTTNYEDTNLQENTTYYYRIFVCDEGGLSTGSNEVTGKTKANERPKAVTLAPPVPIGNSTTSLNLTWSKNGEDDFASYKVFRSNSSGVTDSTSSLITTISDQNTLSYDDTNLKPNTKYYYRIYVNDTGGLSAGSNEEMGKTNTNNPPTPVTLAQPSVIDSVTLKLNWSKNNDDDFDMYTIYRSQSSPVDTLNAPIAIISNQQTTEYYDSKLSMNTKYYYRVFVKDKGGLSSGSNEVNGTPKP